MTSSILKKIVRDLTECKGRSLLTVCGLCVGFWGAGTAAVAWLVLSNDLAGNFTRTNPPAIAMKIEGQDAIDVSRIGTIEGAQSIENRPELAGRIRYAPDRWLGFILWVVEDFTDMRVGTVFPQDGALPPPPGTIVVERDALPIANFLKMREQSGSVGHDAPARDPDAPFVRFEDAPAPVQLAGGIDVMVDISGTVFDPRQAPSRMEMTIYAYADRRTVADWGAEIADRLLVTPAPGYEDEAAIRRTAARLEARLGELGYTVITTAYPSHTRHVHQFQMNSILWLISGVGVLALLMSTVLVVNLVSGILTKQVRQIGVLKTIGASTGQITLMYASAMAVLGIVAGLIALPFAIRSGFIVSAGLAAQLNFDLLTDTLPLPARVGFVAAATLFPVVAALPTIRYWSGSSVTDSLQHFGANDRQVNLPAIERVAAFLALDFRMGLRNAFRNPRRTLITAATLGLGLMVFLVAMNTRTSLLYTAETEEATRRYDVLVGFEEPIDANRVSWMSAFGIVDNAETWRVERAAIVSRDMAQDDDSFILFRVPGGSDMMQPRLLSGRWLADSEYDGVVINHRLQQARPELEPGATIHLEVNGQQLVTTVIGVIKEFGSASIYVRDAYYRDQLDVTDERVNAAFVRLKEPTEENLATLTALLESHFELVKVRVRGLQSGKIASRIIRGHLDSIVTTLLILAFLVLSVSVLGMTSAITTNIVERGRELATLRSIGGTPALIRRILASESLTIAGIGWVCSLLLSAAISPLVSDFFGRALVEYPFDFRFSVLGVSSALVLAGLVAVLASIAPARLTNRRSVIAAFEAGDK